MWILILILLFFGGLLYALTYMNRRNKNEESEITINDNGECCGAHEVCERDSLLNASDKAEYFDDEDLDSLSGIAPEKMNETQMRQLSDVFYTLRESDVAAWLRSLQVRNIQLPESIREEALLIVSERRA
ncbi:MAG: phospholipase [Bacteroidetes bacterium]|jgi:hypothetical protein|nr:phospholipase [Bacteroidota bacterium]